MLRLIFHKVAWSNIGNDSDFEIHTFMNTKLISESSEFFHDFYFLTGFLYNKNRIKLKKNKKLI